MLLHVFAHVDLHEGLFVAEHEFGERLGQQRLADARGTGEQEHAGGPLGIFQSAAAAADGLGNLLDGLVLADDPLMQLVFHLQEADRVLARKPRERHARHSRHNVGDHFGIDDAVGLAGLVAPFAGERFFLLLELVGLIAKTGRLLEVLVGDRLFLGDVEPLDLLFQLLQVRRADHRLEPDAGTGLVDHVDRLVRQAAARDVPRGELDGLLQSVVGVRHAVMRFVTILQTLQDLDRLFLAGRLDHHGLEPPLEGSVLLDVLAVFIERRRTDALQFAAAQSRLEHVGGVDRPFRTTGADERMQLVDEQNRVLGPADFVHHGLDPLFELAAVLRAGDHHRQVEHDHALVAEQFRNVAVDHHLGKALDDGRLADARFAQEDRVVFLPAAENLHDALDLALAADHRVELALPGQLREVAAKTVQSRRLAFAGLLRGGRSSLARFGRFEPVAEQVQDLLADVFELHSQVHQHLGGNAFLLAEQTQKQVLGADVVMVEVAGLFHRVFDDFLGPRRLRQLAHRDHIGSRLDDLFDLETDLPQIDVEVFQDVRRNPRTLFDEAEQNVLGANVFVVEALRLLVGKLHHLAGAVGKSFVHPNFSHSSPN